MSRVEAAAGMDRLPWLPDEPDPQPRDRAAAQAMIGAGGRSDPARRRRRLLARHATASKTVPAGTNATAQHHASACPKPRPARRPRQPQVRLAPQRPRSSRSSPRADAGGRAAAPRRPNVTAHPASPHAKRPRRGAPAVRRSRTAAPWRVGSSLVPSAAWSGRRLRSSTRPSAAGGQSLGPIRRSSGSRPVVPVQSQFATGASIYRFQIGTTSQAHSEVLCQRMRLIGLSCAVVGLPWKAKVER